MQQIFVPGGGAVSAQKDMDKIYSFVWKAAQQVVRLLPCLYHCSNCVIVGAHKAVVTRNWHRCEQRSNKHNTRAIFRLAARRAQCLACLFVCGAIECLVPVPVPCEQSARSNYKLTLRHSVGKLVHVSHEPRAQVCALQIWRIFHIENLHYNCETRSPLAH